MGNYYWVRVRVRVRVRIRVRVREVIRAGGWEGVYKGQYTARESKVRCCGSWGGPCPEPTPWIDAFSRLAGSFCLTLPIDGKKKFSVFGQTPKHVFLSDFLRFCTVYAIWAGS